MNPNFSFRRRKVLAALMAIPCARLKAQPTELNADDQSVIEAFALALLDDPHFGWDEKKQDPNSVLVLHHRTPKKTGLLGEGQMKGDVGDHPLDPILTKAIRARNTKPDTQHEAVEVSYKGLKLNPKIVVADMTTSPDASEFEVLEKIHPKARGWLSPWLPGYSSDGSRALIRGGFGPWPHGAVATAELARKEAVWQVTWLKLTFYA
jgi:hypothetical protein